MILLVLLVSVGRAACGRLDLAAILATTLAGAATAIFVGAEGALLWPVMAADLSASKLRDDLDPGPNSRVARLSAEPRSTGQPG